MFTIQRTVSVYDEYCEGPSQMKVEITDELFDRIIELHEAAKKLNVLRIVEFDSSPIYYDKDDETEELVESEHRLEIETLNVGDYGFHWRGVIKHTDANWETGSISIEELQEMKKVEAASMEELPLMLGSLESDGAKEMVKERLKEGV